MINEKNIDKIYNVVCEGPTGDGLHIDHMPDFFDYDPTDNSKSHVHSFYEIIWFQEAGGTHTVDFHEYPVETNSLFFLSPGQVHHFDGKSRHKGIIMKFCTDFLRDEKADEDIFIKYNVFNAFDSTPFCIISDSRIASELSAVIRKMEVEQQQSSSFGHLDMLRSLVKIFLITVQRYGKREDALPLNAFKPSHRLFVLFRRALEKDFNRLHTVKNYAEMLNVSTKTLSNSVSECSDKPPLTFINDRIILEAKRLLRFTDLMIKEIAYWLGYEDPSYFVKFFKRQTGYLPSEFREMDKEKQNSYITDCPTDTCVV